MEQEAIQFVADFYNVTEEEAKEFYWDEVVAYMSLLEKM